MTTKSKDSSYEDLSTVIKSLESTLRQHSEAILISDKIIFNLMREKSYDSRGFMRGKSIEFPSKQLGGGIYHQMIPLRKSFDQLEKRKEGHCIKDSFDGNNEFLRTEDIKRDQKTTIQARIVFLKLGEIDTIHDRFNASVFIQAKWKEPALDHTSYKESDKIEWKNYWSPKLFVENLFGEPHEHLDYSVKYDSEGKATVYEKRRILSHFQEFMELNKFPFDTQDLTVTLTSERTDNEVEIVEDVGERCALNPQSFVDEQEWRLHKIVLTWCRSRTDDNKSPKTTHSAFSAACKASRRPEFFIWNILVVMFLICSLSFATFAVDLNLPQNRLQLSFILLLTTVSFKFVVNQCLPMIAYLTYLDKYILGSMAILCCICVWHAVVPLFNQALICCSEEAKFADIVALTVLSLIYIIFHVIFIFIIFCVTSKTRNYDRGNDIFPEYLFANQE